MKPHTYRKLTIVLIALNMLLAFRYACLAQGATNPGAESGKPTESASDLPKDPANVARVHPDRYVIGPNDVLAIDVWKETELTRVLPVRPDGQISLPLIGELQASGLTPRELQARVTEKLRAYIARPAVTVIVQQANSHQFNIMGEILKPGVYVLAKPTTVLDALALAGGFRDFAKQKKIYVLRTRPDGSHERLPFNYREVIKGKKMDQNILLRPGDTVVVP